MIVDGTSAHVSFCGTMSTVSPITAVLTAVACGTAAALLTPWASRAAGARNRWLGSGLHVVLAAGAGAGAATAARGWADLAGLAVLAVACGLLVVIDLAVHRLPDVIVGPTALVLLLSLTLAALTEDAWPALGRAALAGTAMGLLYFVLALIAPSGMGLGDVKLAGLLGLFLGWLGWPHVVLGTLGGFLVGGVVAVSLLAARRATMRTSFAFGPWMIVGAAVGAGWGEIPLAG